jgi:hypothetical protein
MDLDEKQATKFLYAAQGVGVAFVAVYLAAYLGGLLIPNPGGQPGTVVLHSDLPFRIPLAILGAVFLVLVLSGLVLAASGKKKH